MINSESYRKKNQKRSWNNYILSRLSLLSSIADRVFDARQASEVRESLNSCRFEQVDKSILLICKNSHCVRNDKNELISASLDFLITTNLHPHHTLTHFVDALSTTGTDSAAVYSRHSRLLNILVCFVYQLTFQSTYNFKLI